MWGTGKIHTVRGNIILELLAIWRALCKKGISSNLALKSKFSKIVIDWSCLKCRYMYMSIDLKPKTESTEVIQEWFVFEKKFMLHHILFVSVSWVFGKSHMLIHWIPAWPQNKHGPVFLKWVSKKINWTVKGKLTHIYTKHFNFIDARSLHDKMS